MLTKSILSVTLSYVYNSIEYVKTMPMIIPWTTETNNGEVGSDYVVVGEGGRK